MIFTSSWIFQFIGHGVYEHRAPALMDNLVQGEEGDFQYTDKDQVVVAAY